LETDSRNANAAYYQGVISVQSDREERSANTVFEQRLPGTSVDAMSASSD